MLDQPERPWSVSDAAELYNLDRWGQQYFGIDEAGFLNVKADPTGVNEEEPAGHAAGLRIADVVQHFCSDGMTPPILLRFPGIIRHRASQINQAFQSAINSYGFEGSYRLFFPVKVNQHFEVMSAAVEAGLPYGGGMEAGSKAELLAVIALAKTDTPILCNGFKDATVVEMALRAKQLGRDVTIVIEKPNEIELVLDLARKMEIRPKLGIRIKLASKGGGHWSSSSGSKSKFGLSIPELTVAIDRLDTEKYLDCVSLLHFHPGSQISDVRKIKNALIEVARVYVDLIEYGVPIKTIDVGGGLAVDYTGNRNKEKSSMNYTLREYANDVIYQIQMVCDDTGTPHPNIYSESGRALVAHHSLLVVPVIGTANTHIGGRIDDSYSTAPDTSLSVKPSDAEIAAIDKENSVDPDSYPPLRELKEIYNDLNKNNLLESFHDAQSMIEMTLQMFTNGMLDIWHRSYAERMGWSICMRINSLLGELDFVPRDLKQLRNLLADTYFGNFSIFQALPDAWAIGQLFPVVPIQRLNERPTVRGVLGDITCDSDGKLDCFVGDFGDEDSLALHSLDGSPYHVAICLIGAYQEALSDDHNLMGKFHIATIRDPSDKSTWEFVKGSTLSDVLEHVHHDFAAIKQEISSLIEQARRTGSLAEAQLQSASSFFEAIGDNYTYLTDHVLEESEPERVAVENTTKGPVSDQLRKVSH